MPLLRFIVGVGVFVGGLAFLIKGNRDAYDLMLFPVVGFVPAAVFTAVVLYPIERIAIAHDRVGHLVWALPLAGAAFPFVTMVALAIYWVEPQAIVRTATLGPAAIFPAAMGFAWGGLWWMTGAVARRLRKHPPRH